MKKLVLGVVPLALLLAAFACGGSASNNGSTAGTSEDSGLGGGDSGSGDEGEDAGVAATCPKVGAATVAMTVSAPTVTEASGIAVSTTNAGVYWVHNDSGDSARTFAIGEGGKLLATLAFDTTMPTDIEDMAIEDQSAGSSFLYFADIGDNDEVRKSLTIHRVAEPKVGSGSGANAQLTATSEKMTVSYVDGPHNAETLLFDPISKDLLIATKKTSGPSAIHRIGVFAAGTKATTEKIASVDIGLATGGEISRDGRLIAIRNYGFAYLWTRTAGESLASVLARAPCTYPVKGEGQGEALAFLPSAKGYVTLSEGASPDIHLHLFE